MSSVSVALGNELITPQFADCKWLTVPLHLSWPQTSVGAQAHDGGHGYGCGFHVCLDWKSSPDPRLDEAGIYRGKATSFA